MVGDVRGLGPMMLAEFVTDRKTKEPATPEDTLRGRASGRLQRRGRHARRVCTATACGCSRR